MNKKIFYTPMECNFLLSAMCFSFGFLLYFVSDDFYNQHIFLFFDLALGAAYTGFLLTALPAWLGYFKDLKIICLSLLTLYVLLAICGVFNINLALYFACIYWLVLSLVAFYMSYKSKVYNNLILMLFMLVCLKIAYAFSKDAVFLKSILHLNTAFVLLINFKISLAICNEALSDNLHFMPNVYYKNLSVFTLVLMSFASASNYFYEIDFSFLLIASAFMIFARLKDFHYLMLLKVHYVACFYGFLLILGLSYLLLAFFDNVLHLVLLSSIALHILLVFNIAGLKHHNLELRFFKRTFISIGLIVLAMGLRFFELNAQAIVCLSFAFIIQFFMLYKIFNKHDFLADV